jgi:hypothetical protein
MRQRVSPLFGMVGLEWLRCLGGPVVTSECRGHILRWPVVIGASMHVILNMMHCGHVTSLVFKGGASHTQEMGVGVERGQHPLLSNTQGSTCGFNAHTEHNYSKTN